MAILSIRVSDSCTNRTAEHRPVIKLFSEQLLSFLLHDARLCISAANAESARLQCPSVCPSIRHVREFYQNE